MLQIFRIPVPQSVPNLKGAHYYIHPDEVKKQQQISTIGCE